MDGSASKREAVERGLLPAIVISGQPATSWHINERMARYHVPGVSVAVISDGKIDWVNGYVVTRAGGTLPAPVSTHFQVESLGKLVTATAAFVRDQLGESNFDHEVYY